jgi:hypothetical protein
MLENKYVYSGEEARIIIVQKKIKDPRLKETTGLQFRKIFTISSPLKN